MSYFVLAIDPPPIIRQLDAEMHSTGAGTDVEDMRETARDLWTVYVESPSLVLREAALGETFRQLADEWRGATRFESSLMRATAHPAYQAILDLGEEVVPLLLLELRRQPDPHWTVALRELTQDDPVAPNDRGTSRAVADAWLRWGKDRHLI